MASLAKIPKAKMKVVMVLILHHLVANFGDSLLKLDCLNPMNMKVA